MKKKMPPKQNCFKVSGILINEKDNLEDDFNMFIKAIDDNHAVILVREHLKNNAPAGRSIIKGIEKVVDWFWGKGENPEGWLFKVIASFKPIWLPQVGFLISNFAIPG